MAAPIAGDRSEIDRLSARSSFRYLDHAAAWYPDKKTGGYPRIVAAMRFLREL